MSCLVSDKQRTVSLEKVGLPRFLLLLADKGTTVAAYCFSMTKDTGQEEHCGNEEGGDADNGFGTRC